MMTQLLPALLAAGTPAPDPAIAEVIARASLAHEALMAGDIRTFRDAMALAPDFVLMDPFGGQPSGIPKSEAHWQRIGRLFRGGIEARFTPIAHYRTRDMIVLVANEGAHVAVGSVAAQEWLLRVTLVFRRDSGEWRLVHRHADPLVRGLTMEQAARVTLGLQVSDGVNRDP